MSVSRLATLSVTTMFALVAMGISACSSGGGDDNDSAAGAASDVTFSGTIIQDIAGEARLEARTEARGGVTICALGECDVSNASGAWLFRITNENYSGGAVLFQFNAPGVDQNATVSNLSADAENIEIGFLIQQDGSIVAQTVSQDQDTVGGVVPTPPTPEDEEPLPADPDRRACEIIRRSNITITNVKTPIVHRASDTCPIQIDTLVAVGNIHAITFEYEVFSLSPDITFDPASESAPQGRLNKHDGAYSCAATESFVTSVTARITRYLPDDGPALTREEAVTACGTSANVGNIEDTVQLAVEVQP